MRLNTTVIPAACCAWFAVGCGVGTTPNNSPTNGSSGTFAVSDAPAVSRGEHATTGGSSLKTIEGDGFTLEAPADWTLLPVDSGIGLSTPNDFENEIPGIPVSVALLPVAAPVQPPEMLTALVENNRAAGNVESETQITVAGRQATRLVTTDTKRVDDTSDAVRVTRAIRVFVPGDAAVLVVQVFGADEHVQPLTPQIDALVASIKLK